MQNNTGKFFQAVWIRIVKHCRRVSSNKNHRQDKTRAIEGNYKQAETVNGTMTFRVWIQPCDHHSWTLGLVYIAPTSSRYRLVTRCQLLGMKWVPSLLAARLGAQLVLTLCLGGEAHVMCRGSGKVISISYMHKTHSACIDFMLGRWSSYLICIVDRVKLYQ